jgi:hypothetical protein
MGMLMTAMDHFTSIDRQLTTMKDHYEQERKLLQDQVFVAQTEAHIAKEQLAIAIEARSHAERMVTKLLTQFGTVAQIFEEAKRLAEEVTRSQLPDPKLTTAIQNALTPIPENRMDNGEDRTKPLQQGGLPAGEEKDRHQGPRPRADGSAAQRLHHQREGQGSGPLGTSVVPSQQDGGGRDLKTG